MSQEIDYDRFATYTIERWRERMKKARINGSGELYKSFAHHVFLDANGDLQKVVYTFHFYGWYVDAGTGRGYDHGNGGNLDFLADYNISRKHRKPKRWYNHVWYGQFRKLLHIIAEELGEKAVEEMMVFEGKDFNINF